jgi:hypothetical protein
MKLMFLQQNTHLLKCFYYIVYNLLLQRGMFLLLSRDFPYRLSCERGEDRAGAY